jgi:hypothetical protein
MAEVTIAEVVLVLLLERYAFEPSKADVKWNMGGISVSKRVYMSGSYFVS